MVTPVTVVGGFLGSGKTTLVNYVLAGNHGLKIAVLVNDFGTVNIDSTLITARAGGIYSLSNGCVCCGLNQDLVAQLEELLSSTNDFDHIIIEASGVADPARIMDTVRYARFATRLSGDAIVVLVDAAGFDMASRAAHRLVELQIGAADLLVVNKVDLVERTSLNALRKAWTMPGARVIETVNARVPFDILFAGEVSSATFGPNTLCRLMHEEAASASWQSANAVDLSRLQAVLVNLPTEVYRVKGIVHDSDGRVFVVHLVGSRLNLTPLKHTPAGFEGNSVLTLIGFRKELAYGPILNELDCCVCSYGSSERLLSESANG